MAQENKPTPTPTKESDFSESVVPGRIDKGDRTNDGVRTPERKIHDVVDTAPPPDPIKKK